ncbi:class I SAM-dependent methyltransferase [Caldimonas brevitalea]|uniref:SAM-dependent methyltransferase n=1 Tax=Caldimonas brevitalea TaxID=413882 RepID=A0A0G3BR61_9BURK|nr:class I SAM-dependent methyltransferase [Caldimonas brevitalea]AKJ29040.1 SAM-dependent methyltransferase [Caldimonas brevitalea]
MTSKSELDVRVERSTRVYDTSALNFYDIFVHGFCNRFAWQCSTETLIAQYNQLVTGNHLEVGVGTAFLIDKCRVPGRNPRLGIMDFSKQCLTHSAKRLERYRPEIYQSDILKPLDIKGPKFDSIGINYVLHCVPGSFAEKGVAFKNMKAVLTDHGVLFGSTLLGKDVTRNRVARTLMALYNKVGAFTNRADDVASLRTALEANFKHVEIDVVGCCALFKAWD